LYGHPIASLNTDSAVTGTLPAGQNFISGLSHLIGKNVDVIVGDSFIGQRLVGVAGSINVDTYTVNMTYEIGLHYDSTMQTMRPRMPQQNSEGRRPDYSNIYARMRNSIGGTINDEPVRRMEGNGERVYTGLAKGTPTEETTYNAYIVVQQP